MAMVAAIVMTIVACVDGAVVHIGGDMGFIYPSANEWPLIPELSAAIGIALNCAIALMLIYINRHYNLMRSVSMLFASMFLIMQASEPSLMGQLYDGSLMCLLVLIAYVPFFATYQRPDLTKNVFLSFFILSTGSLTGYAYIVYMSVLTIGFFQMQSLTLRTLPAAALGIITPYWIMWGLGFITIDQLRMPQWISFIDVLSTGEIAQVAIYTLVSAIIAVGLAMFNSIHIYNYNGRARAYNGFWLMTTVITIIAIATDYNNFMSYLPMLNCCTALQIGHFFNINHSRRSYVGIILIASIYITLYLWNLTI